jgi:hypothetical protein
MVQQQTYGAIWKKTLAVMAIPLFLTGCSLLPSSQPEKQVEVVTKVERVQIPTVARPKPVQLIDTRVYVVNKDNLEQFIEEFTATNGDLAFVALSIKDYENLALNIAELRRFINQQKEVIIYYEASVSESGENINKSDQPDNN